MAATWTVTSLLRWAALYLESYGIDTPRLDAELLLGAVLGLDRLQLYLQHDRPLEPAELARFKGLIIRRREREPLAYITGAREFCSLPLKVNPAVLIPRPETELLVETAVGIIDEGYPAGAGVVDFGTGSGAVVLALAAHFRHRPGFHWRGIDISAAAVALARENAARLNLQEVRFDIIDMAAVQPPAGGWDVIVSNPPYIIHDDLAGLQPEVQQEPAVALDGGPDGLNYYRLLAGRGGQLLAPGGWILFEVGAGQAPAVAGLLAAAGMVEIMVRRDLQRIERVVGGRWMP
jgi:release factor glutamine methyltransferase